MEPAAFSASLDNPSICSLCLDTFKDPVAIPCGHSFCMGCIGAHWDDLNSEKKGVCCPLCNETFGGRPQLCINRTLVELLEHFQTGGQQAAAPEPSPSPEDILCDVCTEEQTEASRSCLVCMASYCEPHLKPHRKNPVFQSHRLVPPVRHMEDKLCKVHLEPLEGFCRTDQACVCLMCAAQMHKEHAVVTLELEKARREEQGPQLLKEVEQKMKEIGSSIVGKQAAVQLIKNSALKEKEDVPGVLEKLQKVLVSAIEREEQSLLVQAEEVLVGLEEELRKLGLQRQKLEKVPNTDPASFIQVFQALKTMVGDPGLLTPSGDGAQSFTFTCKAVRMLSDLMVELEKNQESTAQISLEQSVVIDGKVISKPLHYDEPDRSVSMQFRSYFLQYAHNVVFDADTAEAFLVLTGNEVKRQRTPLAYPENDKRFRDCSQVLGQHAICSGRHYWEVEILNGYTSLGLVTNQHPCVSYQTVRLGRNKQSWCLRWDGEHFAALHNNEETELQVQLPCKRIGVFFEINRYWQGTISFYGVEPLRMRLLHMFYLNFSSLQQLPNMYPAFYLESVGAHLKICPLTRDC